VSFGLGFPATGGWGEWREWCEWGSCNGEGEERERRVVEREWALAGKNNTRVGYFNLQIGPSIIN
jgi:hypothetical protein